jgi:MFS family permease
VLAILFGAYLLCYTDRMVMASAIPFIARDLHLSPLRMGEVLSAFFVGYSVMQIPGGVLADRFGSRAVLTGAVAWWSVMTALTGMMPGLTALLAARVLFGLGEGPFPPAASKTLSAWFPVRELGRANGLQYAAVSIGATVAPLFVVALVTRWGWRSVFYSLFIPGICLAALVWAFIQNSPRESRYVSEEERRECRPVPRERRAVRQALLASLQNPSVLWCAVCLFFANMAGWGLLNWLPVYLLEARGFDVERMGIFTALTNLAGAIGYPIAGHLCDRYFSRRLQVPLAWGLVLSALFTYLAANAPSGQWAVAYLTAGSFCASAASTAIFTLPLVLVPPAAVGGAFGIVNTAGQFAGIVSPLLIGYLLSLTGGNFTVTLYCLVGVTAIAVFPATRIKSERPLAAAQRQA